MAGYVHGITRENVFEAASEIFAGGKNPTQASVRSRLGKGSFSTISKYLSEWRQQQTDVEAIVSSLEEMPEEVELLLKRTYGAIRAHVEGAVVGEQVELLEAENEKLRAELGEHQSLAAELSGVRFGYQELMAKVEQLTRENERLIQEREELAIEVKNLKNKEPGEKKPRTSRATKAAGR